MKRFWLVLLSLGLITAFSTSAMAVDIKISGEYYAAGMYLDKTTLHKNVSQIPWTIGNKTGEQPSPRFQGFHNQAPGPSTAFYYQRLRLNGEVAVAPGLKFITRADVMERAWGAARSAPPSNPYGLGALAAPSSSNVDSAGTVAENENIAFDLAYINYTSPIGMFNVGYQIDKKWGTVFGDNSVPNGQILYGFKLGGYTGAFIVGKESALQALLGAAGEQSAPRGQQLKKEHLTISAIGLTDVTLRLCDLSDNSDADTNYYQMANYYQWKHGEAGLLLRYQRVAVTRDINLNNVPIYDANGVFIMNAPLDVVLRDIAGYGVPGIYEATINLYILAPYFKYKIGNVSLEGELHHVFGKWAQESSLGTDIRIDVLNAYLNAQADFGKFYMGGTLAYLSGDDPNDNVDRTIGLDGGAEWNPCLIMWNRDRTKWAGSLNGYTAEKDVLSNAVATFDGPMFNAWFFQARAGVRPVEKLDIGLSVSFANAVVKPTSNWLYNDYGWEVDLTATYKITNNLTYMVGGGYLFTGNYFKAEGRTAYDDGGAKSGNPINNVDYMASDNPLQDNYMIMNKLTLTF